MNKKIFYVYMLHESPVLQSGNPRALRCWEYQRRPTEPFGFRLPSKEHAARLELKIHERLANMGLQLRRDHNYVTHKAAEREWFSGMDPGKLWSIMVEMYCSYTN